MIIKRTKLLDNGDQAVGNENKRRFYTSVGFKLGLLMLGVILLMMGTILAQYFNRQLNYDKAELIDKARSFSSLSVNRIGENYTLYFDSGFYKFNEIVISIAELSKDLIKFQIIDVNRKIVYDSLDSDKIGNVVDEEIGKKIQNLEASIDEEIIFEDDIAIEIVQPYIEEWGRHQYSIRYIFTYELLNLNKQELLLDLFMMGLLAVLLSTILLVIITGKVINKPLMNLLIGVSNYSQGKFGYRIKIGSDDEFGKLGGAFNLMANRLSRIYEDLENQVKEKTKKLTEKMEILESKTRDQELTKKAMINLLEDGKELEEELKKEKEGIEQKVKERTSELTKQTQALEEARKRATEGWIQLQAEEARLNASIEALPLGLVILDTHHEVVAFNQKVVGISENIIGKEGGTEQFDKFIDKLGLSVDEVCPHCNDAKIYIEEAINYKNKYIKVIVVPVISEKEVIGSTYLFEDVTEAKKLQKTRDEFFSVASHELRTPLTAIRGNTQMLQDYYPEVQENSEVKEMLKDIHTASVRLIGIVNDFLDASRLELKKTEMKISQFSIKELVEKTMEQVNPEFMEKELEYKLEVGENTDFMVNADKDKLQQVLINLIGNAIKFTKTGGVYLGINDEGNGFVKVSVTDTGTGINQADQAELFAKFKQVGSNAGLARDVAKGTGMGLYISKLIMEALGGRVYLEKSEEGKGSTFAVEVPKASK